jgi:hypothetical protein
MIADTTRRRIGCVCRLWHRASIIGKVLEGQVPVSTAHDSKEGECSTHDDGVADMGWGKKNKIRMVRGKDKGGSCRRHESFGGKGVAVSMCVKYGAGVERVTCP